MARRASKSALTPTQLIVMSFLLVALIGGLLLCLPAASAGEPLDPVDALFMSTTAVCVTGLATVDTGRDLSRFGHIVILCLIQVGGLGYMVLSTAFMVLMGQRVKLRHKLVLSQAMGEARLGHINSLLSTVIAFTFFAELLGAVALACLFRRYGTPWGTAFELGVFHSVSAFCNAGLDLLGNATYGSYFPQGTGSLTPFVLDPWINLVVAGLIIAGGLGFVVALDLLHGFTGERRHRRLSLHTKIVLLASAALIALGTVVYLLLEWQNPATLGPLTVSQKILNALFQSITPRTAGFNLVPQSSLYPASQLFTTFLMFVGASPGGTGGGIKTTTFVVLILAAAASVRGDDEVRCFKRRIGVDAVYRSLAVVFFMALVVCGTTFLFGVFERQSLTSYASPGLGVEHQFVEFFFEATSALGTVGLSTGITPTLSTPSKLLVVIVMLIGRMGPVTLAMALAERKRRYYIKHPVESVMIG